jgi:hypothetical protein
VRCGQDEPCICAVWKSDVSLLVVCVLLCLVQSSHLGEKPDMILVYYESLVVELFLPINIHDCRHCCVCLSPYHDSVFDINAIKQCSSLLQREVRSLGEEKIDDEQFDKDPYIIYDVVCELLVSLFVDFTFSRNMNSAYISIQCYQEQSGLRIG